MRGFQLRYSALVAGSLVVLLVFSSLHSLYVAKAVLPADVSDRIWHTLTQSSIRLFFVGLFYIGVVTVAAVFLSHRITGPAFRLEQEIRGMVSSPDGIKPLKIRQGDELEGVVEAVNELVSRVKETVQT